MTPFLAVALLAAAFVDPPAPPPVPAPLPGDGLRQLLKLRRVYVDRFGGGETAAQMRDMVIAALQNTRLFVITANQDKADAILRGSAEDLVFNDVHSSSEGINVHSNLGTSTS